MWDDRPLLPRLPMLPMTPPGDDSVRPRLNSKLRGVPPLGVVLRPRIPPIGVVLRPPRIMPPLPPPPPRPLVVVIFDAFALAVVVEAMPSDREDVLPQMLLLALALALLLLVALFGPGEAAVAEANTPDMMLAVPRVDEVWAVSAVTVRALPGTPTPEVELLPLALPPRPYRTSPLPPLPPRPLTILVSIFAEDEAALVLPAAARKGDRGTSFSSYPPPPPPPPTPPPWEYDGRSEEM
mmetsp:Transcript_24037/g.69071  ORF Transcript_24037/g.69071 Transcript_24037/m.69071 type:complete len:238 (+) Transcript_24037:298-1011(+)